MNQPGLIGATIGGFEILEELGRGGMATVYRARQRSLNRIVALKILSPGLLADPSAVARFEREAHSAAALDHPNIVAIYDVGQADGYHFIAMQYLAGATLQQHIRSADRLGVDLVARWFHEVAVALDHAHHHGVLHRDIKPANIIITHDGRVYLTDFGLARALTDDEAHAALTGTGYVLGTLAYMSPEQARGAADLTPASDVYALGVTLYEALTRGVPFRYSVERVAYPPHPPSAHRPDLSPAIDAVVLQALELQPAARFASAGALAAAFAAALRTPTPARAVPPAPPAPITPVAVPATTALPARRRRPMWLLASLALGGLLLVAAAGLWLGRVPSGNAAPPPTPGAARPKPSAIAQPTARAAAGPLATPSATSAPLPTLTAVASAAPVASATPAPPAAAPVGCAALRAASGDDALSCYAGTIADALLQAGYRDNITTVNGRTVLRANPADPVEGVWARDLDYALQGFGYVVADASVFRESIALLLEGVRDDGVAPEGIFDGRSEYVYGQSWDSMPNLISAAAAYQSRTGDDTLYLRYRAEVLRAAEWIVALDSDADGLPDRDVFAYGYYNSVTNGPLHTYAIARFYRALLQVADLEAAIGETRAAQRWRDQAARLRKGFHRPIEAGGYWRDDQAWPIAWRRADGTVVSLFESFGVFEALRSGLIAPDDPPYPQLIEAIHAQLPALLAGPAPLRLVPGGYDLALRRELSPPLPEWKMDASAPWITGIAVPVYAAAGHADDAARILAAYERAAQAGPLPRLVADGSSRYGAGREGDGGAWEASAWFLAVYQGHYGISMTPEALVIRPAPFLDVAAGDGVARLRYGAAVVSLTLDAAARTYAIRSDQPITVLLEPMAGDAAIRVDGGPAVPRARLELAPGQLVIVESRAAAP